MRSDFTSGFTTAMQASSRSPRTLAVFHFPSAGDIYVSDQVLGAADGLDNEYAALVENWGTLVDMAGGDPTDPNAGEIRQMSVTLWNGGTSPFSDYFLNEDPENVEVDVYQWFTGLADSDKALIDTFVIQDPIAFDEASRLLSLDLVSLAMRYDPAIGDILTDDDWPNAKPTDIGKSIPIIIGTPGAVPTLCAKTAPQATLNGSILETTLTVIAHENLDDLEFSAAGTIQIGEEKMRYSSRTSTTFTIIQRGYLSTAVEHIDRNGITEVIADFTFLVGMGPMSSIGSVKVGGFAAIVGTYTAYPALNPARIVFSEKPYSIQYAQGSTFLAAQFDAINADNTAWQAHYAYDDASDATAAKLNPTYPKLSLHQATAMADRGPIVKAYLAVEHWESAYFAADYCEVWVEGVGVVGRLSRPNPADTIEIAGEVDIDHGHSHQIAGDHTHSFTNPTLSTVEAAHGHGTSGISTTTTYYPNISMGFNLFAFQGPGETAVMTFPGAPDSWDNATLHMETSLAGVTLTASWHITKTINVNSGTVSIGIGERSALSPFTLTLQAHGLGYLNGSAYIGAVSIEVTVGAVVDPSYTGVVTSIHTSGANAAGSDKSADDVDDLATDNQALELTTSDAATRTHVNLFDITSNVNFDWSWFTDRDVTVTYTGSAESKDVYILHCFFDIEYRKKEIVFSDDVTCEPVGLIDDASGTITGTPSALITRPDHVRHWVLTDRGGMDSSIIDTTTFAAAGARYDTLAYAFNGCLNGDATVREIEKKLARQCRSRFFWNAGLAKIALREMVADWSIDRDITTTGTRLKSISAIRQNVADMVNKIDLYYGRDWTDIGSGNAAYQSSTTDQHTASVAAHGIREKRDAWQFDLVTTAAMANDLLDFYLENRANPSTFYTFESYLTQLDLEKEDVISLTSSGFGLLRKARMVIRAADRLYGSGKLSRINRIRIVAECLRYILLTQSEADTVSVSDNLIIEIGLGAFFDDAAIASEIVTAALALAETEYVTVADALAIVAAYAPSVADTATAADALALRMSIAVSDQVVIGDDADCWRTHGFGAGLFGSTGFGGYVVWHNRNEGVIIMADVLSITTAAALADTATAAEALAFSNGFGGSFSCWGQAPFGS